MSDNLAPTISPIKKQGFLITFTFKRGNKYAIQLRLVLIWSYICPLFVLIWSYNAVALTPMLLGFLHANVLTCGLALRQAGQ